MGAVHLAIGGSSNMAAAEEVGIPAPKTYTRTVTVQRLFTQGEVRSLFGKVVKECREELIKAGKVHYKRGLRIPKAELLSCVKRKWNKLVKERMKKLGIPVA